MSSLLPTVDPAQAIPAPAPDLGAVHGISVRALNERDGNAFKAIRLEALRNEGNYFGTSYEEERKMIAEQWRRRCKRTGDQCLFGLFHDDNLVGIMAATKWSGDPEGKTVLWGSAYVRGVHRGKGLAAPLYEARRDWSIQNPNFDQAVFFIRDGNERSTEIHKKQGAEHTHDEPKRWADGTVAVAHWYKVQLRAHL